MQTIKRGLAPEREASILQVFLQASGYKVNPDGNFGVGTEQALRQSSAWAGLAVKPVSMTARQSPRTLSQKLTIAFLTASL